MVPTITEARARNWSRAQETRSPRSGIHRTIGPAKTERKLLAKKIQTVTNCFEILVNWLEFNLRHACRPLYRAMKVRQWTNTSYHVMQNHSVDRVVHLPRNT